MGLISEIRGLEAKHVSLYVATFFGTIASGFLILFYFRPELIDKYDVLKLTFLSLSITLPLILLNLFIVVICEVEMSKDLVLPLIMASLFNALAIYVPLLTAYFLQIKFRGFLLMIVLAEVLIFLLSWLTGSRNSKKAG